MESAAFDFIGGWIGALLVLGVLAAVTAAGVARGTSEVYRSTVLLSGSPEQLDTTWQRQRSDLLRIVRESGGKPHRLTVTLTPEP